MSLRHLRKVVSFSSWLAILSLLQPSELCAAPTVQLKKPIVAESVRMRVADVALQSGGILQGQVVNDAGAGVAGVVVELTNGQQSWQTKSDAQGWFRMAGLRGGVFQFQAMEQTQLMRIWATGTAPPRASQGVLVSLSTEVIRGQHVVHPNVNQFFRVAKRGLARPMVVGGIVATAVAIPVAIHNSDDDPPATP